eukprot:COSAG02_NODE_2681_length_8253_cov_7.455482_4_plen_491_part_00
MPKAGGRGRRPGQNKAVGLKLACVGESAGGKSAFLHRLLHSQQPTGKHKSTDGCYRHNTAVKLDDGTKLPLQIWDTPGKASFADIASVYEPSPISGADGLIIVYDASSSRSASSLKKWVKMVRKAAPPGCRGVIVGTKKDLVPDGKVPPCRAKAVALAKANGMRHAEVSAADEDSVADAVGKFIDLIVGAEMRRKQMHREPERRQQLTPNVPNDMVVQVWLEQEGLGDYAEVFAGAGYTGLGCLAELQALERPKLLVLCRRINGELPTPRPEGEDVTASTGATAPSPQAAETIDGEYTMASSDRASALERSSQGSTATSKADTEESRVLSVLDVLAGRGLAVYTPLFESAGYDGPACAVELAELAPGQLEKLCYSLEKPLPVAATTDAELQLKESDCVDLAAWLTVRGPYNCTDALSRLRVALRDSNPHSDTNSKMVVKSGVIAPLVALFLVGVTSPDGEGSRRSKIGPGGAMLAATALDVCVELSRSPE